MLSSWFIFENTFPEVEGFNCVRQFGGGKKCGSCQRKVDPGLCFTLDRSTQSFNFSFLLSHLRIPIKCFHMIIK